MVNVLNRFLGMPWMITPSKMEEIIYYLEMRERGIRIESREDAMDFGMDLSMQSDPNQRIESEDPKVGVIPVLDTLTNTRMSPLSGGTSYKTITKAANYYAENDEFSHVVLDIHSPGGTVAGIAPAAEAIRSLAAEKTVIAVINDMAASAAYFLASQATEVVASDSSIVGSIGVIYAHVDARKEMEMKGREVRLFTAGKYKSLGSPFRELSEDDAEKLQARVDKSYNFFVSSVSNGRGMDREKVLKLATGEIFDGKEAVALGLADRVQTLNTTLSSITMPKITDKKEVQANAAGLEAKEDDIQSQIAILAEGQQRISNALATFLEGQQAKAEAEAEIKARQLVAPYLASGVITPAQAHGSENNPGLIEQAAQNFDLVAGILANLGPVQAIPLQGARIPAAQIRVPSQTDSMTSEEAEVFQQLGIVTPKGDFDPSTAALPIGINGQLDVKEGVKTVLDSWK